jgi:hypothetical protein
MARTERAMISKRTTWPFLSRAFVSGFLCLVKVARLMRA